MKINKNCEKEICEVDLKAKDWVTFFEGFFSFLH